MTNIRPLDPAVHSTLRYDRNAVASTRRFVQLGLSEIALAAADMPLCLAKDEQTGGFNLVALLGLVEPANLFAQDGRLHATYLPRAAILSCFRLDADGAAGLAIDADDSAIGSKGQPLFDDGVPASLLKSVHAALNEVIADVTAAQRLIAEYVDRRLIRPLGLRLREADGHEQYLDGLYALDTEAIAALPDADVLALHRIDALAAAGVLSASMAQLERLRQLHNARFPRKIASTHIGLPNPAMFD